MWLNLPVALIDKKEFNAAQHLSTSFSGISEVLNRLNIIPLITFKTSTSIVNGSLHRYALSKKAGTLRKLTICSRYEMN